MLKTHLLTLLAGVLLLSGCGKDAADADKSSGDLYARVPADTAYFATNTNSLDPELQEIIWQQMITPINDTMQNLYSDPSFADAAENDQMEQILGLQEKLLAFLSDVKTPEQWAEKTGLATEGQGMIYALELFPVISQPVADQAKLETLILDAVDELQLTSGVVDVDGNPVNAVHGDDDGVPVSMYWSISSDRLTTSILPDATAAALLPLVFGEQFPTLPMSAATVAQMNEKYGFDGIGSGFFKPAAVFKVLSDDNTQTRAMLSDLAASADDDDLQTMLTFLQDPVCTAEMNDLLSRVPQISLGMTEFSKQVYRTRVITALDQRSKDLMLAMLGDAPIGNDPRGLFNMAVNINVGTSIKALRSMAEATLADPFQCEQLQGMNDTAQQLVDAANSPIPPFVGNMTGFAMQVAKVGSINFSDEDFDPAAMLDTLDASFALYTSNAQMLLGMGQMFLPQLNGVDLQPGAEPQAIDVPDMGMLNQPVYAALTEKAIGISYGESSTAELSNMLQGSNAMPDAMLTAGIDAKEYNRLINDAMQQGIEMESAEEMDDPEAYEDLQRTREMMQKNLQYSENLGQNFSSLRITEDGLVLDTRQEFNFDR
jgi:hypothetical protein